MSSIGVFVVNGTRTFKNMARSRDNPHPAARSIYRFCIHHLGFSARVTMLPLVIYKFGSRCIYITSVPSLYTTVPGT